MDSAALVLKEIEQIEGCILKASSLEYHYCYYARTLASIYKK